jgi:hypothetical protein
MRTVIQIILAVAILILGYLMVESIMKPIRFNRVKDKRWNATIERLKDIRTAQLAYKAEYGEFTGSFDTLINFVKNDSFKVVKAIGSLTEDQIEAGLTEREALRQGIITRDTIKISVLDSLFYKGYAIDSMRYVPYTPSDTFTMGAGEIETGAKVNVEVFEAKVKNDVLLHGLDEQLVTNFNDERIKITGYPGLKVGSLEEATNNAGNWE